MADQCINEARAQGVTHCPNCGQELDYENRTRPNGAQADEIIAYAVTQRTSTELTDWQVLCATCNRSKGKKDWTNRSDEPQWPHSRVW